MRVAVVGVCGSGKTTIVDRLRRLGYDAYVVGQEHSIVKDLWNHQGPDSLVSLEVSLEVLRCRRDATWPAWIYELQRTRLADARAHAAVSVDTSNASIEETVREIASRLGPPTASRVIRHT